MPVQVFVKKNEGARLPEYKTEGAAGADIFACVDEPLVINCMERKLVSTGLFFEIPCGYEIQVRPRSGLALKNGITILNSPGTIDSDYRGEIGVLLINLGAEPFTIHNGDRIAQLVISHVEKCSFSEADELGRTERGAGGYGSTGIR